MHGAGIETASISYNLEELYGALNTQANLLDELREKLIEIVTRPLVDNDDELETKGDEFEDSTKVQEELMATVQAVRTIIADRSEALSGQTNTLMAHEVVIARAAAKDDMGPAPMLTLSLLGQRDSVKPKITLGSIRGILTQTRSLISTLTGLIKTDPAKTSDGNKAKPRSRAAQRAERAPLEREIALRLLKDTQAQLARQTTIASKLEAEMELFTTAMNTRLDFYRQLQSVSDNVAPPSDENLANRDALEQKLREWARSQEHTIATAESKQRYREQRTHDPSLRPSFVILPLTWSSASPPGIRVQVEGAEDVHHLPVTLYYWRPHHLRPPVLQGVHDDVVAGSPQLPRLQARAAGFEHTRHYVQTTGAQAAHRAPRRRRRLGTAPGRTGCIYAVDRHLQ